MRLTNNMVYGLWLRVQGRILTKSSNQLISNHQHSALNPLPCTARRSDLYHKLWTILSLLLLGSLSGCGVYSFTGASLGPDVKTISIDNFFNDASGGPPNMSQVFTEEIRDYYQANTNLALVTENGDLLIEGAITRYEFVPVAPRASGSNEVADVAGLIRLNIAVSASYINTYNDEFNFENKTFTFFADFDSDRDPSSVEEELIEEIFDQIIFDIFAATVANW
ncbi:MAG: LptE family protein [Bacteroidota bacterium]